MSIIDKFTFLIKKSKKSLKKKVVRNFLTFFFFEFFSENVFKTLLRKRETTRKNYRINFEKYTFFDKKIEKNTKKKAVRNFLTNIIFIFLEFFSENVFETLLRRRETRKKYRTVFEIF